MDSNRFTEKAHEALVGAQRLATRFSHQQVDVEHVLLALLDQEQDLTPAILGKLDISADALKLRVQRELEKLPRVSAAPEQMYVSGRFNRLLAQADEEAKRLKDDYVSVEHVLLAMTEDGGAAGHILKEFNVTRDRLLKAMQEVRGH